MEVSKLKEEYPNPPIKEVAWEIQFDSDYTEEESAEIIRKYGELISKDFPIKKEFIDVSFIQKLEINLNSKLEPPIGKSHGKGFEYYSDKGKTEIIKFRSRTFGVITTQHLNYSVFLNLLKNSLSLFEEIVDVTRIEIKRLGLRYINHCELPSNNSQQFHEYFNVNLNLFDKSDLISLNQVYQEMIDLYQFRTQFHSVLIQEKPMFVIDLDCFILGEIRYQKLIEQTTKMEKLIKSRFADSIKPSFVKNVMERQS